MASAVNCARLPLVGKKYFASLGRSLVIGTLRRQPASLLSTSFVPCPAVTISARVTSSPASVITRNVSPAGSIAVVSTPSSVWTPRASSARVNGPFAAGTSAGPASPALERAGDRLVRRRDVDDAGLHVEVGDVGVEVVVPAPQLLTLERLGLQPQLRQRLEAQMAVRPVEVRGDRALADVQAAAADEHVRARLALELAPEPEGLVGQAGVAGVEVVVAERPRAAVGGGHRVADAAALEDEDTRRARGGVVRGEAAHDAAADDDEVVDLGGHAATSVGRRSGSAARRSSIKRAAGAGGGRRRCTGSVNRFTTIRSAGREGHRLAAITTRRTPWPSLRSSGGTTCRARPSTPAWGGG